MYSYHFLVQSRHPSILLSTSVKQLLDIDLLYELSCYSYFQKLPLSRNTITLYNHLCLTLTLKFLPIMFHLMIFRIILIYNAKSLNVLLAQQNFYQRAQEQVTFALYLSYNWTIFSLLISCKRFYLILSARYFHTFSIDWINIFWAAFKM